MRTLAILLTLVAIRADAAERTWTIARDVYTAEAELIAVRGELVYLKIDGRVEEIPLARLSGRRIRSTLGRCRSRRSRRGRRWNRPTTLRKCRCRASPIRHRWIWR